MGVFDKYSNAEVSVKGFSCAKHQAFPTLEECVYFMTTNGVDHASIMVLLDGKPAQSLAEFCSMMKVAVPPAAPKKNCDFTNAPVVYVDGSCDDNGSDIASGGIGIFGGLDIFPTPLINYPVMWTLILPLTTVLNFMQLS